MKAPKWIIDKKSKNFTFEPLKIINKSNFDLWVDESKEDDKQYILIIIDPTKHRKVVVK